jgi:hypothetical protein
MTSDTAAARDSADPGFIFGPRETGGVILGLRGAQLGALVLGLTALVGGLSRGPIGAAVGLGVLAACAAFAFVGVGGRTADQWAPVLLGYGAQRLRGQQRFRSGPFGATSCGRDRDAAPRLDLPGGLGTCRCWRSRSRAAGSWGWSRTRPGTPSPRSSPSGAPRSRCWRPRSGPGGSPRGERSWPGWPGKAHRWPGCSGSSGPCPTPGTRC